MPTGELTTVVFGGGGFIGRHLIRRLGKSGSVVRIPTRHVSRVGALRTAGFVGQIVPEMIDVFDDVELKAAIGGADHVVNLIGILSETRRQKFNTVHAELPGRIARLAREAGVKRLVHVSALGASADSASAYARSKQAGESAVKAAFPEATILRPSIVFGPEDSFFNRFAAMAQVSPALPLIGGGNTKFQPVYVGDVADAIEASLERPEAAGQLYELGGPQVYSFKALMELLLTEIRAKRALVSIPWTIARWQAAFAELFPSPLLTRDQVKLLMNDNILSGSAPGLEALGLPPTAAELILPTYLDRFRKGGRFSQRNRAYP